jgi:phosphoribosylanthranilate isomerase
MLKKKILVRKVYNLTDARYYSAMNVDWISFDLSEGIQELLIKHYTEIIGWIEGPGFLLEPGKNEIQEIIAQIPQATGVISNLDLKLETQQTINLFVPISLEEFIDDRTYGTSVNEVIYIVEPTQKLSKLKLADYAALERKGGSTSYFLDIRHESGPENQFLRLPGLDGFVFHGGAEEKVGVKSFEEMDEWFDFLGMEV